MQTHKAPSASSHPRWRPPPRRAANAQAPVHRLDEKLLRRVLEINPVLRAGRSTVQVKRDFENGATVSTKTASSVTQQAPAPQQSTYRDAAMALDALLQSKLARAQGQLAQIEAARCALVAKQRAVRAGLFEDVRQVVGMLDPEIVRLHGLALLAEQHTLLSLLNITPQEILSAV